jgi:predicted anti-sigma-YlaC factor YlaD
MQCDRFREAISAWIDGEDLGLPDGAVDAHLKACADCLAWRQRAHVVTRRARLGGLYLDHDLTPGVLAVVRATAATRRRRSAQRAALAAVAATQLAITVPLLLGHDRDAGTHASHELSSFDLSLAIAFAVGAVRPALAAGLAWPCAIAAAGLTGTAAADLIGGQTLGADEAQHLVAMAGALLLVWQARTNRNSSAGGAAGPFRAKARTRPVIPRRDAAVSADGSPGFPGDGKTAAVPVPGRPADGVPPPGDGGASPSAPSAAASLFVVANSLGCGGTPSAASQDEQEKKHAWLHARQGPLP